MLSGYQGHGAAACHPATVTRGELLSHTRLRLAREPRATRALPALAVARP